MKHSDVLVVGSGIAGLMASITAARSGAVVTVLSQGAGVLSIGSGAVDFLGYIDNKKIHNNPFDYLNKLPSNHPYSIVGESFIKESFDDFIKICNGNGFPLTIDKSGFNKTAVSVMGTLRPTYISSVATDAGKIFKSKKIAVISVEWLKDCQPKLTIAQLKQYAFLKETEFSEIFLKSPFGKTHRTMNCLDLARYVDKSEGSHWLESELVQAASAGYDFMLIPPICGVVKHNEIYSHLIAKRLSLAEMVSVPPGVGGYRMLQALLSETKKLGITFVENCFVAKAKIDSNKCLSLITLNGDETGLVETEYKATNFIIATGGVLGGGIDAGIDGVKEKIFGINIDCPSKLEDRTNEDVFGDHPFASIGVKVSHKMRPCNSDGAEIYSNVFFAGKILSGYDFAKEKSGYGVALVTGRKAAKEALKLH